ncbi:unnamed protein product [Rotaria magnacalcarata]|uniref:Uncharacterized protein n=2 Tax=Rotaria magnacalcarata TaxID=392030 RepID=A0A815ZNS4_9BILA|nr:unnamed protein product [Rotaria magnacalcarata]CAF2094962.1 unnamed protein product [Rotaria magnacalcarata]
MMFLILFSIFIIVHGQLSNDELFIFNSKYTLTGDCNNFQYIFKNFGINSNEYNQLILNCNSSTIIFRNNDHISSSFCPDDDDYFRNFRVRFPDLSQTSIQVNQLHLYGIELCSLDDLIRSVYGEYSYYRSTSALLINLENSNRQEKHHLAITTNGEMTFILTLLSTDSNGTLVENKIELIFPNENIFQFKRSSINVWRIDQGYVRTPRSVVSHVDYQLSKSKFTLFNNETFFLYGTQISYPSRFLVSVDETLVSCNYTYVLRCTFPILPLNLLDIHQPKLKIMYNSVYIFNTTLTLIPRTRLHKVPINHSLRSIGTFQANISENTCANDSLKSLFSFIVQLWKEDGNGSISYNKIIENNIGPIDCNQPAKIGQYIEKAIHPTSSNDIISMNVDLAHQWYDHQNCRTERTRIMFS